ncbi:tetratricopeptide repeat protein [Aureispira sp. CCB-E]|uniref:tetratricopeptide repeat protein n=1 Tax=Aureispira sp. CCB-E TaxID=3051121 RepID=UPI00286916B1|nr:tetratricopeptide repeat protein [Aureispira sp. CCB-E]WMX13860.1 tetratricopeptide repeat protein [Aureispira sp. CCB-E]
MNRIKILTIILLSFITLNSFAQSETNEEKALEYGKEAVKMIDKGEFKDALKLLHKAQKLDPKNIIYPYEVAYIFYIQKNYKKAISELEKQVKRADVTEQHFQLLGNSYDLIGNPDKALEVYQKGLEIFPNSGKMYLEQGIVEYSRENYDQAIAYWEKGVEVAPTFASNYFWLGQIFCNSSERIWGVLYGEIFMNLERNSQRTVKMSQLLFETYKKAIDISSDSTAAVLFSKTLTINANEDFKIPFQMNYGMVMTMALTPVLLEHSVEKELSLQHIHAIRQQFIQFWYQKEHAKNYPNVLFDFHKQLQEKNYFEAYNYWFLMKGNEEEFGQWYDQHQAAFDEFAEWFNANPIEISKENYFSRLKM